MFSPRRQDVRQFFFDTWKKHRTNQALSDLEKMALAILIIHPEYHPILEHPEIYLEKDWTAETAQSNPFLHMSLHMAIDEQRSIDQPPGIRALYSQLLLRLGNDHATQHAIMEALGDTLWQAQQHGNHLDANAYLKAIRHHLGHKETE